MITSLKDNQIIVVGTNTNGAHYGGAANQAHKYFGLEMGVGEGLSGKTYAFPTLDGQFKQRTQEELIDSVQKLYDCCLENKKKEFLLTAVGTGIANFSVEFMKSLFINPPKNLVMPKEFI